MDIRVLLEKAANASERHDGDTAVEHLLKALKMEETLGNNADETLDFRNEVAEWLLYIGDRFDQVIDVDDETLARLTSNSGIGRLHKMTLKPRTRLAWCLLRRNRASEAIELLRTNLGVLENEQNERLAFITHGGLAEALFREDGADNKEAKELERKWLAVGDKLALDHHIVTATLTSKFEAGMKFLMDNDAAHASGCFSDCLEEIRSGQGDFEYRNTCTIYMWMLMSMCVRADLRRTQGGQSRIRPPVTTPPTMKARSSKVLENVNGLSSSKSAVHHERDSVKEHGTEKQSVAAAKPDTTRPTTTSESVSHNVRTDNKVDSTVLAQTRAESAASNESATKPRPDPKLANMGALFEGAKDMPGTDTLTDRWFKDLRDKTHCFVYGLNDRYADYPINNVPYDRIKIAIIDTGLATARHQKAPRMVVDNNDRLQEDDCKSFDGSGIWGEDVDGHGTHAAMLALQVCRNAELMILRVVQKRTDVIKATVAADAIRHAVKKGADIISISLGWKYASDEVNSALLEAQAKQVLIFAATSNEGVRDPTGIAHPARALTVISVDSASGEGQPSTFNPPTNDAINNKGSRLTAPGENVLSAFPPSLEPSGLKRKTGTSFATPIAAGVAGLILEFARQPPLSWHPRVARKLKETEVMRPFLNLFCADKHDRESNYWFLHPWKLLSSGDHTNGPYGGDAADANSMRYLRAYAILLHMVTMVDPNILGN